MKIITLDRQAPMFFFIQLRNFKFFYLQINVYTGSFGVNVVNILSKVIAFHGILRDNQTKMYLGPGISINGR